MADTKSREKVGEEEDWEYEDENGEDYEWEYESEEDKEDQEEELDLPDPFLNTKPENGTKQQYTSNGNHSTDLVDQTKKEDGSKDDNKHKKHHKKPRQVERMELFKKKDDHDENRKRKIHVRSKDPSRIAKQFEKGMASSSGKHKGKHGKVAPPPLIVSQVCKICGKEPYVVERVVAEKCWWHKNCFRCKVCNKTLTLDTYMSHEGILYCKPHHRELFQPKVVLENNDNAQPKLKTQEAIERHKMQERRMETIIRENNPLDLGDSVVKSGRNSKYEGLEGLDVGSKFRMFERNSESPEREPRGPASDRFGIMEKLKRLQEGEDLEDLLAEINEELPSEEETEEVDPTLTNVQRRTQNADKLFSEGGQDRRQKMAEERRREVKAMRQKAMAGTKDNVVEQFDDLLNASANKVKKTQVDVRSKNAKKFREMFDKGQVPEAAVGEKDKATLEKEAELEMMRKGRRDQRDFFKKMESGQFEDEKPKGAKETLLVRKLKDMEADEVVDEDLIEMAPLANRFSFFENFKDKEVERQRRKKSPHRDGEIDMDSARKECKARSVLNKFKEMETRALNGEIEEPVGGEDPDKPVMTALGFLGRLPGVAEKRRPNMKRFTPPRKVAGSGQSDSESDYSESDYSDTESYTSSSYSSDGEIEDETLKAIRAAARAKELRAKFEEWEQTQDAKDQYHQMLIYDENGETLDTASNLRAKFEALQMHDSSEKVATDRHQENFRVKRFK